MNRNSVIPKTQEKLTDKHSYLPYFAYHVQSSSLCRTAQTQTHFFRYYRWPLFLISHSPFPIPHSPFPVLVTSQATRPQTAASSGRNIYLHFLVTSFCSHGSSRYGRFGKCKEILCTMLVRCGHGVHTFKYEIWNWRVRLVYNFWCFCCCGSLYHG